MSAFRVAAAQYPVTFHEGWAAYASHVEGWFASAEGADMLVFPEYGSMELTSLLPADVRGDLAAELAGLQGLHGEFVALHERLARRHGVYAVAPSFPLRRGGGYRNVAHVLGPEGPLGAQEKLMMTRFEREKWGIGGGTGLPVFNSPFGRFSVAICYDAEFPLLVRRQVAAGASLVLVPSCTDGPAGYHRVRVGCQARALEGQCYVVQAPTVGEAPWSPAVDVNVGAAGVFGPCDRGMPPDGVLALGEMDRPGWVFCDLDFDLLDAVRRDGQVFNLKDWPEQERRAAE